MLQHNAETPLAKLADAVHLSNTPCWRCIQWLREKGYITRHVALVDPRKVNVGVTVFVAVKTNQHHQQWFDTLRDAVMGIPEIVEFYRMSGDVDQGVLTLFSGARRLLPVRQSRRATPRVHVHTQEEQRRVARWQKPSLRVACPGGRLLRCPRLQGASLAAHGRLASNPQDRQRAPRKQS